MEYILSDEIRAAAPEMKALIIEADVVNAPSAPALDQLIDAEAEALSSSITVEMINKRPAIAATRTAYKKAGKDPNRYRPAAEQLCRRVVRGLGLYRIDSLVDLINLISLRTGYSIGGFDADKITGDTLTLGIGREGEPYEGIGRGELNISGMPVWRDNIGGIGTPTSDNERTKISVDTRRLVMIVNIYGEETSVDDTVAMTTELLEKFAGATNITHRIIK